jgi:hypothetical protein
VFSQTKTTFRFEWGNDTLNGEFFEKTSMHIPVKLYNDTTTYYFQFDTGADVSFLYIGDTLYKKTIDLFTNKDVIETNIGKLQLYNITSNSIYSDNGKIHIGTIGADFLKDKKIEIDFKNQIISLLSNYSNLDYHTVPMETSYGRPIITLNYQNSEYKFLFDTGSSLFELWTTKKIWKKWADANANIKGFPISSWGKINTAFRAPLKIQLTSALCSSLIFNSVWYNSNKKFDAEFKNMQLSGIIGNKPFLETVILLDFESNLIGVKNCR